nr:MAG TPA: hypothetical protein [Caudoviricetes sp.]
MCTILWNTILFITFYTSIFVTLIQNIYIPF